MRIDFRMLTLILTTLLLSTSPAIAGGIENCPQIESNVRVKIWALIQKYRATSQKPRQNESILLLIPGGKPEITEVTDYISKEKLDAIKASSRGNKVLTWNNNYKGAKLLPYGSAQEMSDSFNPAKDCSPSSQTIRNLNATCDRVDLSKFESGAALLHGDSADECALVQKYAQETNLSEDEEVKYREAKKKLTLTFGTKTGENRSPSIDKESTVVLPKKNPRLEIGGAAYEDSSPNPAKSAGSLSAPKP